MSDKCLWLNLVFSVLWVICSFLLLFFRCRVFVGALSSLVRVLRWCLSESCDSPPSSPSPDRRVEPAVQSVPVSSASEPEVAGNAPGGKRGRARLGGKGVLGGGGAFSDSS